MHAFSVCAWPGFLGNCFPVHAVPGFVLGEPTMQRTYQANDAGLAGGPAKGRVSGEKFAPLGVWDASYCTVTWLNVVRRQLKQERK